MSETFIKLGDHSFITKLAGFEHSKYFQYNATHEINEIPLIQGKNIRNGKVVNSYDWYISKEISDLLPRSVLNKRCIVLPYVGSKLGELAIFENEFTCHLASNVAKIEMTSDIVELEYLYYYLIGPYGQSQLFKDKQGSAQPNITMLAIRETKVKIFDKTTQQQIAKVLSDLDAKIELNNKINAELEAMAKLIYDYWFVQFEFPNKEGKPYKSSGGKMVWNEKLKREVPEGWEVKQLKDFAQTGSGATPLKSKPEYYLNGNIPWINSGEVNASFIVKAEKFITKEGINNSSAKLFKKGTILMAMYGATAGQVSLMDIEACTNQAICGINPHKKEMTAYLKFGLEDLYNYLISLSSGSARDNLSQDKIRELYFVIPKHEILSEFDRQADAMLRKILINMKENQKLSELRDWLLPMLMNGQVKVDKLSNQKEPINMAAEEREKYR